MGNLQIRPCAHKLEETDGDSIVIIIGARWMCGPATAEAAPKVAVIRQWLVVKSGQIVSIDATDLHPVMAF